MFDNAPFSVRVLLIYLNDSRSSPNLSTGRGTPARTFGVHASAVPLDAPPDPSPKVRYPLGSRVGDLTQCGARFFEIVHKSAMSHADLRPPNTFQTTYQQQSV